MQILARFLGALPGAAEQGILYAILALGIMITYSVLHFPDLTVDGSFPLGGAVSTALLGAGWHPLAALALATLAGALAGLGTGLIHVRLKVRDLFSGIIMMTALYSINLRIAGGRALISLPRPTPTLFRNHPLAAALPQGLQVMALGLLLALMIKFLLDLFFQTRAGYLLRACGDNPTLVTALARDQGRVKIVGLMLANALAALSGAALCQQQRMFEISMGTGAIVLGLASVMIGISLLGRSRLKQTTAVIAGAILYRLCVALAIACGLQPGDLRLITAVLFLLILASGLFSRQGGQDAGN